MPFGGGKADMGESTERLRLVFLGLSQTGKSAVIRRFVSKTFTERYKPTVEELYYREFDLGHIRLKVDIMDTAGDFAFPAMRRLAIAGANAFVIVYSVDNVQSFDVAKQCFEEIREERKDFAEVPLVFVGNKCDLTNRREVFKEDVCEWVFCELPKMRAKVLECSAKDDFNVKEIFRTLLQLSKYPYPSESDDGGGGGGGGSGKLIRRSSAYVSNRSSSSSSGKSSYSFVRRMSTTSENTAAQEQQQQQQQQQHQLQQQHSTPASSSSSSSTPTSTLSRFTNNFGGGGGSSSSSSSSAPPPPPVTKPRSRSLIRRCSRKAKQQMRDAQVDDCSVS